MLKDLRLVPNYSSDNKEELKNFYYQTLSNAIKYDRASAFFSAKSISNLAKGIVPFYKNGGKIRLIISSEISEDDYKIIKFGYNLKEKEEIYNKIWDNFNYDELNDDEKIDIANVAFLIQNNAMEIKIAFMTSGIFHDKFGIIEDQDKNCIYFNGSNNETESAIKNNHESFDISCSWLASEFESKKINIAKEKFERYWKNKQDNLLVLDMPEIIKMKVLKFSKGKIVNKNIPKELSLLLDIDRDNKRLIAKIGKDITFNDKNYTFKTEIKQYVDYIKENIIYFEKSLSYIKYEEIISRLQEYVSEEREKDNICYLIISEQLEKYIDELNFYIEKRCKLGKEIKEENLNNNEEIINSFERFKICISNEMIRTLKEKQLWNAFHIVKMKKSANFSVPGAGKTTIVYGAFAYLSAIQKVNKIVMIGPKSSFISWKEEFKANFGNRKKLMVCDIQEINRKELIENAEGCNLILINYESLPGIENELSYIINESTLLVFDEVHKIKGVNKIRANVALKVSKKASYKVALTGTPIPNSYIDLYNLLNILYSEEYNDFFSFTTKFLGNADESDSEKIIKKIYPFFCRITKKDLKIPLPDSDIVFESQINCDEMKMYELINDIYRSNPFTYYIRMMQAMTNPELLNKDISEDDIRMVFCDDVEDEYDNIHRITNNIVNIYDIELKELVNKIKNTDKFNKGIKLVRELTLENKSVLVWGIFNDTLQKIKRELEKIGITCGMINGSIKELKEREKIIHDFLNGEFQVLIANPNTVAESISLHRKCHDAVYFEYSFNYTHMAQSRDRINRLGLCDNQYTRYYYLMCGKYSDNNSVDNIIYNRLKEKETLMLNAIENGEFYMEKNTLTEDILSLLRD